jgi:8-oxo-dGTP pyrophosphatase MutT (NUDIX family)
MPDAGPKTETRLKRMAASAVLLDRQGRLLCVKPIYRPDWLLPGGMVELDESPLAACRREVAEEIGLDVEIGRLLCVDYRSTDPELKETLFMVFSGGELSDAQVARIKLPPEEISEHRFLPFPEALAILAPRLALRMKLTLHVLTTGETLYLENGLVPHATAY